MTTATWKQPILFNLDDVEPIAEEEATVTLDYTPPIVLPAEAELETTPLMMAHEPDTVDHIAPVMQMDAHQQRTYQASETVPAVPQSGTPQAFSPWMLLLFAGLSFLGLLLLVNTYSFIATQFESSFLIGGMFFILISAISVAAGMLAWRSYQNILSLRAISSLQAEGRALMKEGNYGNAIHYINHIAQFYTHRPDIKARLDRFYITLNDSHHDDEIFSLFTTQVMSEVDQQAYQIVTHHSKETALLVTLSPIPLLSTIITLWRNIGLIRDIATLYGGRPSLFASASLITTVLQNIIYANVSETLANVGMFESMGGGMFTAFSAQAAQGLGSGLLTARVGLKTMEVCRPLPFTEETQPSFKDLRWNIISAIKNLFDNDKNNTKKAA